MIMARFACEICGASFNQRSRLERHQQTSHPPRAPSAADLTHALGEVDFPKERDELVDYAKAHGETEAAELLQELPDQTYRDAAEVTRALSAIRRHEAKPEHQPSRLGGLRALKSLSAARIASLFEGVELPASGAELRRWARDEATAEEMEILEQFGDGPYHDMSDVAKEFGKVVSRHS